jgi:hypothetical protein
MAVSMTLALGGCGSAQPAPRSDDVVVPAWVDAPARPERPQALRIEEHEGTSHAGRETSAKELERRAQRRRADEAQGSTLLPKSANSKFFGGCGAMKSGKEYKCSK